MADWKERLYAAYVSSGHARKVESHGGAHSVASIAYYRRLIRAHLPRNREVVVADVACGHGALIQCLKEMGYRSVVGIDSSEEQVALAHETGAIEVQLGELGQFLASNARRFDLVFLMDILEHIDRASVIGILDAVQASLRPEGTVIIHVPNAEGLFGMRVRYGDLTHESAFTPRSMTQLLSLSGFEEIACYEDTVPITGIVSLVRAIVWMMLMVPFRLLLIAEAGWNRYILSQNMLVVARKAAAALPAPARR